MAQIKIDKKITGVSLKGSSKTPQKAAQGEVIIPEDVTLPDDAPARMKTLRAEGRKWYLTVVYHPETETPFALFCHTNSREKTAQTSDALDRLLGLAKKKGVAARFIKDVKEKCEYEANTGKITRTISLLLRHGVLIKNIVAELDKMEDIYAGSFLFQLKKFLSNYIHDGEVVEGQKCSECGGELVYSEGCFVCKDCGGSKCG